MKHIFLLLIYILYKIKQDTYDLYVSRHSTVAEERGFEPRHTVTCLRAFQARPFNRLGIPPISMLYNYIKNISCVILYFF